MSKRRSPALSHLLPDTNSLAGGGKPLRVISCSISHTIHAPMLWPNRAYVPCLQAQQLPRSGKLGQGDPTRFAQNRTAG